VQQLAPGPARAGSLSWWAPSQLTQEHLPIGNYGATGVLLRSGVWTRLANDVAAVNLADSHAFGLETRGIQSRADHLVRSEDVVLIPETATCGLLLGIPAFDGSLSDLLHCVFLDFARLLRTWTLLIIVGLGALGHRLDPFDVRGGQAPNIARGCVGRPAALS
jgi:hypothetical protein